MSNKIPITRKQAEDLLDIAHAVIVDDIHVCCHTIHRREADVGDTWLELEYEDADGYLFQFNVAAEEDITWDGTQVSVEGLDLQPLLKIADMVRWQAFISRIEAKTVAGGEIRVELRPGTHKLKFWRKEGAPEGVVIVQDEDHPNYPDYTFPELAPPLVKHAYNEPVVAEIMGRRWKIAVRTDRSGGEAGAVFETTDEPVTEPDATGHHGDCSYWFGQPKFIQNTVLPHLDGKSAYPLQTRETGWGDSGNENVFVTFDEQGIPNGLYVEASCC